MNGQGSPPGPLRPRLSIMSCWFAICAKSRGWCRARISLTLSCGLLPLGTCRPQTFTTVRKLIPFVVCCLLVSNFNQTACSETNLRVRVFWGGDEEQLWRGSITLPDGQFSDLRLLGLDGDQPGAYVNRGDTILISPRYESKYVGFEATVAGELDDEIRVTLTPNLQLARRETFSIPLKKIVDGSFSQALANDHRFKISRCQGDTIRVRFPRESMIFTPGEQLKIDVMAHELAAKPGSTLRAKFRIRPANQTRKDVADFWSPLDDGWSQTETIRIDEAGQATPLEDLVLPIPKSEGAYDLTIELAHRLPQWRSIAKRTIQFAVVDQRRPPLFGNGKSELVTEFDPAADPKWFERLTQLPQWRMLPGNSRGPWSNAEPKVTSQDGQSWTQLAKDEWVAYSLPIGDPGKPHILELTLPPNAKQTLGVSILEPNASTQTSRPNIESSITLGDKDLDVQESDREQGTKKHRLVFWPGSSSPIVVLSNRSREANAIFGKIRIEAFPAGLPVTQPITGSRKRIARLDGELLQRIFLQHAKSGDEGASGNDTWHSFLTAGQHLVEYLRFAGYDGATIKVVSDGSSLYPSDLLLPTPRYDRGIYSTARQDPIRKDILEMLLRLFDREGLALIPAIEFSTPLPIIEDWVANGKQASTGLELVDANGQLGAENFEPQTRRAPYYNLLDDRVQKAMRQVVDQAVERYAGHQSFQGLTLVCSEFGFSHLHGNKWGFDELTLDTFAKDVLPEGSAWTPQRLHQTLRADIRRNANSEVVQAWLQWRANRVTNFYDQLAQSVARNGDVLFVSLTGLMNSQQWQQKLRPALPRKHHFEQVLKEMGLDIPALQRTNHLILLRPNRIAPLQHLGSQAVNLEVTEPDIQQAFGDTGIAAAEFEYETRAQPLASFSSLTPLRKNKEPFLTTAGLAGAEARKHFVQSLALHDDKWIFQGGRSLAFGQEDAMRSVVEVFRELPNRDFKPIELNQRSPILARISYGSNETVAYFVNVSPWIAQTGIQWKAPNNTSVEVLGKQANEDLVQQDLLDRSSVDATIEPYGIFALRFGSKDVEVIGCNTELPVGIARQLRVQLDDVVSREKQLEIAKSMGLLRDGGFEAFQTQAGGANNQGAAWTVEGTGTATQDLKVKSQGNASAKLTSAINQRVSVLSHEFAAPETGRLVVSLTQRASNTSTPPRLVLRLESSTGEYQPFHLFEQVAVGPFQETQPVSFSDLPTDPDLRLRLRIELVGSGEVWIDDVRMYDRWIDRDEKKVLRNIIHRAVYQESKGDLAACFQTLSSYWPRFLLRHVPPPKVAALPRPQPIPRKPAPKAEPRPRRLRFDLRRLVPKFN